MGKTVTLGGLSIPAMLIFLLGCPLARAEHPSNGWIVWASDRQDSRHEIYMMEADGSNVTRLTTTGARMPMWSPDGRWIAYETVPLGRTRVMRWDKSEDKEIFNGKPKFWLWDGSRVVCMDSNDDLYMVDPENGNSNFWLHKSDFSRMADKSWSPSGLTGDGRWLVTWTDRYRNGYTGSNGYFDAYHSAVLLDMNNKGECYFIGSGCEPTTPPGGDWVYHVCGGGVCATYPDVYRMRVSDRDDRSSYSPVVDYADPQWGHEYFPRISTDGNWLVYGATDGDPACHPHDECDYEIFIHQLGGAADNRERLTSHGDNDQWPHLYVGDLWGAEQPELHLDPTSRNFTAVEGGANPGNRTIAVTNAAGGTLDAVTTDESAGWLTVTRSGSGNTQTLTNAVDIGGLSAGNYNTTVDVNCANATNSPQTYTINLTVTEPEPVMTLSPTQLTFGSVSGGANPAPQDVAVGNSGGGTLDDVSVNESAGWLTVQRSGSGNSQTLENQIDINGLADGSYNTDVEVSAANATNSPRTYTVALVLSEEIVLASIDVVADSDTILSGGTTNLTATPLDQYGDPISSPMSWSVSGGGSMHPESGSAATEHVSEFRSDGTAGDFVVTASSGGVEGTQTIQVAAISLPLRINCGSNSFDVDGWLRDDPFVSGGSDWDNPNTVDVDGVVNAAPVEVYQSVRHSSPHAYTLVVPDGTYLLRMHFADAYTDRSMDYFVEGLQILDDFDITTEAGGVNRALVKDFQVTVADGNGMQIAASGAGDVFECGIEVLEWVFEEPQPDGDGGSQPDGDGGSQEDGDGGEQPSDDGGEQPADDGGGGDTSGDAGTDVDEDEIVVSGGCGCASSGPSRDFGFLLVLLLGLSLFVRRQP